MPGIGEMNMDLNIEDSLRNYMAEIRRTYYVLPREQANMQNLRDIKGWLDTKLINDTEAFALAQLNARISLMHKLEDFEEYFLYRVFYTEEGTIRTALFETRDAAIEFAQEHNGRLNMYTWKVQVEK